MEETQTVETVIAAMQATMTANSTAVGLALITVAGIAVSFKYVKGAIFG
jgi:hypothetical protein